MAEEGQQGRRPEALTRRRAIGWIAGGVAAVAGALFAWRRLGRQPEAEPMPQEPEPKTGSQPPISEQQKAPPREGPQLPPGTDTAEEMDRIHRERLEAFPAKTSGKTYRLPFREEGGVKVFELETKVVQWEVEPGVFREAWTYNGVVPGPEIRVREDDRVRVVVRNGLPESTTIHWHGMRVENSQDGVSFLTTPVIKPGETFTYEFTANPAGTHMYHSHHNSTKQVAMGLLGPLIVEPKDPGRWPRYDREYVLVLNDGPLGFTINGKSFPATEPIVARRGERVLLRWMNEGAMVHPMHLHGLVMEVVARDGWLLPAPYRVDTVTVAPGERWDTLVVADNPGKWALHCHVLPHAEGEHGMFGLVTVFIVE
ncbi:MAG: copper oxidase [Firmicutes bacterium]|nr:copper oxidase [Bacillota bacterium]